MKKLILGLLVFGLTTLGFSQQRKGKVAEVKLQDVTVTTTLMDDAIININYSYLDEVQDQTTAEPVKLLESHASKFNVKDLAEYSNREDLFEVMFRGTKGYIIAYYDNEGKILESLERYRNVKIPKKIVKNILQQFPESQFLKMAHTVNFSKNKDVRKTYRIRILTDNSKKNLKFTSYGDNANSYAMTIEN